MNIKRLFTVASALMLGFTAFASQTESERRQMLLGLYTSDLYATSEQGMSVSDEVTLPDTVVTTTYLPASLYQKMTGGQIDALRFALANDAVVKSVVVYKLADVQNGPEVIAWQKFTGVATSEHWNTVQLNTPCPLPSDARGILIGFTYEESQATATKGTYPLSINPYVTGMEMSWISYYKTAKDGFGWHDYSEYGALSIQAIVSSNNIPDYDVVLMDAGVSSPMLPAGKQFSYQISAYNFGVKDITSYKIQTLLDDTVIDEVTEASGYKLSGAATILDCACMLPANTSRGSHTLTIKVVSVNGETPTIGTEDDEVKLTFGVYNPEDAVTRQKYLVEEFTSHSCTNCPLGAAVLETIQELNDSVALACIHGNLESKDPFNNEEHDALNSFFGINGWPFASFNRNYSAYDGTVAVGIGYSGSAANTAAESLLAEMMTTSIPAFATVDIETVVDSLNLNIKVSGKGGSQARSILDAFSLTVYVLEDGLKYRQKNNGAWDKNYIHDNVIRKVATAINGDAIQWTSESEYLNEYNVTLDEEWKIDNMHVIAFLSKRQPLENPDQLNMAISNANDKKITDKEASDDNQEEEEDLSRYNANLLISPMNNSTQLMCTGFAPNYKYVAGMNYVTSCGAIWNTETNEITNCVLEDENSGSAFFGVNSQGIAVGGTEGTEGIAIAHRADGTSLNLFTDTLFAGSMAWAISENNVIVGSYYDASWNTKPCYWNEKGELFELPSPTEKELGFSAIGAQVRYVSEDASIMAGYLTDSYGSYRLIIWRREADGKYNYELAYKPFYDGSKGASFLSFEPKSLSANGKWVSVQVQEAFDENDWSTPIPPRKAARLNLETMEIEILTMPAPLEQQEMEPCGIANDGSLLAFTMIMDITGRVGYYWPAGANATPINLDEDVCAHITGFPNVITNTPSNISKDGTHFMGFGITEDAEIFSYIYDYSLFKENSILSLDEVKGAGQQSGIFNLQGIRLNNASGKGLFVIDGKVVLIKQ